MTFFAACAWSLLRSLTVAVVGVGIASRLRRTLIAASGRRRTVFWSMTLLPLFVPGLLIGYGYRNFSLSLVHHPLWNEFVYAGLVMLTVVPVGTLILVCSPAPPLSQSALHVRRLAMAHRPASRMLQHARHWLILAPFWLRSRLFSLLPAAAAMFLLTFQETEVAALMQARGWPEWIFTRLPVLSLSSALLRVLGPMGVQIAILGAAIWVVRQGAQDRPMSVCEAANTSSPDAANWGYLLCAVLCLLVVPGGIVLRGTSTGFAVLAAHPSLMRQIGIALLFGVSAGLLAWFISGWIIRQLDRRAGLPIIGLLLVPGLLGTWILGLSLAWLFQTPWLRVLSGTPLPMVFGETLFQLPRAVLVRLLLGRVRGSTAAHSATLLAAAPDADRQPRAADLMWQLDTRGRVVGALIICYWAYMERTIPSLLGPPGMTTAPVLMYNLMHYAQTPGLSALVLVTIAVPVVCLIGLSLAARWVSVRPHSS